MPRKICELIADLERAGFSIAAAKAVIEITHPLGTKIVPIAGKIGDDAKPYQEKQLKEAINEVKGK